MGAEPAVPVVAARGIGHHYGRQRALAAVDLELARGAAYALVGPNGAGKSTLLRILAGLTAPTRGELLLFGERARGDRPALRRRIGLLGHETFLYARLTALENLNFWGTLYGLQQPATRAAEALWRVGLAEHAGRLTGVFSRGMRQRLALARLLLTDPELVLLDEPYTGLDPAGEATLDGFLDRLRSEGRTIVLVTHRPDKAARLADAAGYLARGRLRALAGGDGKPLRGADLAGEVARLFAEAMA